MAVPQDGFGVIGEIAPTTASDVSFYTVARSTSSSHKGSLHPPACRYRSSPPASTTTRLACLISASRRCSPKDCQIVACSLRIPCNSAVHRCSGHGPGNLDLSLAQP